MTQPPPNPTPPPAGPPPAGGGFVPPAGPAVPAQHVPQGYAGPPGYPPPGYPPPGYAPAPLPPPVAPNGQPLAGFGDRLIAYLIDTAVAMAVTMVLLLPVFLLFFFRMIDEIEQAGPNGPDPAELWTGVLLPLFAAELGVLLLMLAFYWIYHVEYARRTGQTLGKKVMKLRIVPVQPDAALSRGMLGKRWAVEFAGGMFVPFLSYLDGFWQLWDKPWQQCLHDKFAGTVVVKVGP
ncbi:MULTISPECIES: RDD family protein [unclassified Micromonospora]|uniref:RDD family protein n=1 Tax=unclassified Micromonospora TaxID=2617518 RepID=UPI001B3895FA|nr:MULTISPECIES: RDD family protein [unclassified Micromonospora]MBQ1042785.1 RDD family protein [Micromonospora sp. C72]MBQ1054227.1 RDD family protein [Micromonospora sp. C32]